MLGLHLGIIYGIDYFGSLVAGGLGYLALQTYFNLEDVGVMNIYDARFITAWWIGFVIYGILALVLAGVFLFFPKTQPRVRQKASEASVNVASSAPHVDASKQSQAESPAVEPSSTNVPNTEENKSIWAYIVGLFRSAGGTKTKSMAKIPSKIPSSSESETDIEEPLKLPDFKNCTVHPKEKAEIIPQMTSVAVSYGKAWLRLLKNPLFLLIVFGNAFTMLAARGYIMNLRLYLQKQFTLLQTSNFIIFIQVGCSVAGVIGTVAGGILTTLNLPFNLHHLHRPLRCLQITVALAVVVTVVHSATIGLGCSQPILHNTKASEPCSSSCTCMDIQYSPQCGTDGLTYYSACHASCQRVGSDKRNGENQWQDCKCMQDDGKKIDKPYHCDQPCKTLPFYSACVIIGVFFIQLMFIPSFLATLRSVHYADAPLAIGFNIFMVTLIGAAPSHYMYDFIMEITCTLDRPPCGPTETCALYDIEAMRYYTQSLSTGLRALAALFYAGALMVALKYSSMYADKVYRKPKSVRCFALEQRGIKISTMEQKGTKFSTKVEY